MHESFRRRLFNSFLLGIPSLASLAFLPKSLLNTPTNATAAASAIVQAAAATEAVLVVDDAIVTDARLLTQSNPLDDAQIGARLKELFGGAASKPLVLRPRTNFKQYRKPRGLSSAARRRQNPRKAKRK